MIARFEPHAWALVLIGAALVVAFLLAKELKRA